MDQQMPLVSIIVPVYNVQNYLKECIDSILMQTLSDLSLMMSTQKTSVIHYITKKDTVQNTVITITTILITTNNR